MSEEHKKIYNIWLKEEQIKKLNELEEITIENYSLWKEKPKSARIHKIRVELPDSVIYGRTTSNFQSRKDFHLFMDETSLPRYRDTLEVYNKATEKRTRYTTKFAQSQLRIFKLLVKVITGKDSI